MSHDYTYAEIASDWSLWTQYVDPDATMTRPEFDALTVEQRIALQVEAFGPERQEIEMTTIASALIRKGSLDPAKAGQYIQGRLVAVGEDGEVIASFPPGTPLDVALASAKHRDSGAVEDLVSLLKLEARDGNSDAAAVLKRYGDA